jgi:hypothetical protein
MPKPLPVELVRQKVGWQKGRVTFQIRIDPSAIPGFKKAKFILKADDRYNFSKPQEAIFKRDRPEVSFKVWVQGAQVREPIGVNFDVVLHADEPGAFETTVHFDLSVIPPFTHYKGFPQGNYAAFRNTFLERRLVRTIRDKIAQDGGARVMWVHGAPGVGKTVLMHQLQEKLGERNVVYVDLSQDEIAYRWELWHAIVKACPGLDPMPETLTPDRLRFDSMHTSAWSVQRLFEARRVDTWLLLDGFYANPAFLESLEKGRSPSNLLDGIIELAGHVPGLHLPKRKVGLIVTDIQPFEWRLQCQAHDISPQAQKWLKGKIALAEASVGCFSKSEIRQLLGHNFFEEYPAHEILDLTLDDLWRATGGHPQLVNACLHDSEEIYAVGGAAIIDLEKGLAREQARSLIGRYEQLGVLSEAERKAWNQAKQFASSWFEGKLKSGIGDESVNELLKRMEALGLVRGNKEDGYQAPSVFCGV